MTPKLSPTSILAWRLVLPPLDELQAPQACGHSRLVFGRSPRSLARFRPSFDWKTIHSNTNDLLYAACVTGARRPRREAARAARRSNPAGGLEPRPARVCTRRTVMAEPVSVIGSKRKVMRRAASLRGRSSASVQISIELLQFPLLETALRFGAVVTHGPSAHKGAHWLGVERTPSAHAEQCE